MQQQKQQLFIISAVILFSSLIRAFFRNKRAANWQTPAKASKIQHHHITTSFFFFLLLEIQRSHGTEDLPILYCTFHTITMKYTEILVISPLSIPHLLLCTLTWRYYCIAFYPHVNGTFSQSI